MLLVVFVFFWLFIFFYNTVLVGSLQQLLQVEQLPESPNVGLSHLERLVLAQFSVVSQVWNVFAEALKSVVQSVHPLAFASVGSATSLAPLQNRQDYRKKYEI